MDYDLESRIATHVNAFPSPTTAQEHKKQSYHFVDFTCFVKGFMMKRLQLSSEYMPGSAEGSYAGGLIYFMRTYSHC